MTRHHGKDQCVDLQSFSDNIKRLPLPSAVELTAVFKYDPDSGIISYVANGRKAGYKTSRGYVQIHCQKRKFWAHRVAWKMTYGYDPREVDHINRDKSDNRLINLREVDRTQNNINAGIRKTNNSGVIGVHWDRLHEKWIAQIRIGKKTKHLGAFPTKLEAIAARRGAERALDYRIVDSAPANHSLVCPKHVALYADKLVDDVDPQARPALPLRVVEVGDD